MPDSELKGSWDARESKDRLVHSQSEERLRAILLSIPDYVILLDRDGTIVSVVSDESRPAVHRGLSAELIVGRSILDFVSSGDALDAIEEVRRVFDTGGKREIKGTVDLPAGPAHSEISLRAVRGENGEIDSVLARCWDVSERENTMQTLRVREAQLANAQRIAHIGSFDVDLDSRTLHWSEETFRICYLDPAVSTPTAEEFLDLVHPDDRQSLIEAYEAACKTTQSMDTEYRIVLPQGTVRFIHGRTEFVTDKGGRPIRTIGTVHDISERRRTEQNLRQREVELAESEEKFSTAFNAAPWPMLITGAKSGEVIEVNEAFIQVLGYTREDLSKSKTVPGDVWKDEETERELREEFKKEGRHSGCEVRLRSKSGRVVIAIVSAETIQVSGRPCVIWQGIDVNDRIEAENERREFQTKMVETQKLESLGVLTGGIAHDFNNLLVAIQGNVELALLEAKPGGWTREILAEVQEASGLAAELTEQLLAYTGKGEIEVHDLDLSELVRDTSKLLRSAVPRNSILKIDASTPAWIRAEATQIRQVVMNLITNAAEALGSHGGEVHVHTGVFRANADYLATCRFNEGLTEQMFSFVEVRDRGCGMDAETLQQIFDPFYTSKATGRGLGLAAVTGIVRSHNGTLRVDSEPGEGTVFRVLFPIAQRAGTTQSDDPRQDEVVDLRPTVLVIDDDAAVRKVAGRMLQGQGFRVLDASSGQKGLEIFREQKEEVVVAILDATMPGMTGAETFRALRSVKSDLPVVFISGHSEEDLEQTIEGEKRLKFLKKPFTIASLITTVRDVLNEENS